MERPPAPPILIEDPADPRIEVFRAVRERDLVGRQGLFIAEGASVLAVLLCAPVETVALLVEASRVPRLAVLSQRGAAPLYVAPQEVLNAIAGFHLHRGILGVGRIPQGVALGALPDGPLRLAVLVGLSNHDNVGGIFRNAAAFGAAAVALDETTADPFYRKALRVGVGAQLVTPHLRTGDIVAFIAALRSAEITPYALTPGAGETIGTTPLAPRAAFLFGTEGPGLSADVLACAQQIAITMSGRLDSLNVATASGIALHAHALQHGF